MLEVSLFFVEISVSRVYAILFIGALIIQSLLEVTFFLHTL